MPQKNVRTQIMAREREGAGRDLYRYSGIGLQFAATLMVFALAGHWLDGKLGASPWFLIGGVFLGFALGLYSMTQKLPSTARLPPRGPRPPER